MVNFSMTTHWRQSPLQVMLSDLEAFPWSAADCISELVTHFIISDVLWFLLGLFCKLPWSCAGTGRSACLCCIQQKGKFFLLPLLSPANKLPHKKTGGAPMGLLRSAPLKLVARSEQNRAAWSYSLLPERRLGSGISAGSKPSNHFPPAYPVCTLPSPIPKCHLYTSTPRPLCWPWSATTSYWLWTGS